LILFPVVIELSSTLLGSDVWISADDVFVGVRTLVSTVSTVTVLGCTVGVEIPSDTSTVRDAESAISIVDCVVGVKVSREISDTEEVGLVASLVAIVGCVVWRGSMIATLDCVVSEEPMDDVSTVL